MKVTKLKKKTRKKNKNKFSYLAAAAWSIIEDCIQPGPLRP